MQNNTNAQTGKNIQRLFDEYIYKCQFKDTLRPETIRGYKSVFETFCKLNPINSLEELTEETITRFFKTLQTRERIVGKGTIKTGVKKSTVHTYASKLHSFFEWLKAKGCIEVNPLEELPRVRVSYDDSKALRKAEIDKLRAAVESHSHTLLQTKRNKAMLSVLLFTGVRRGELHGLEVMDISLDKRTLKVRQETSKSGRTRIIPLNEQAVMHLQDYLTERNGKKDKSGRPFYKTARLFGSLNEDRGLSKDGFKHWVDTLREQSGVRFHLHQFRHTFTINLGAKGVNTIQIQKLLGHTDLRMTERYLRSLNAEDLRPAVDKLSFDLLV